MLNLSIVLEDSARGHPDRDAVVFGDIRADLRADQRGGQPGGEPAGVPRASSRVTRSRCRCPNLPYFPVVYYGILKAGAVVVPLNVLLKGREIAYHLDDSDAKAYFCFEGTPELPMGARGLGRLRARADGLRALLRDPGRRPAAASPIEGADDALRGAHGAARDVRDRRRPSATDTAVILYTSGTTGQPKGAELTHANMLHERADLQPAVRERRRARTSTWSRCRCSTPSARPCR